MGRLFAGEFRTIADMGRLAPNWDGHGATAAPPAACEQAARFLQRAEQKFGQQLKPPRIGAVPGGVVLLWRLTVSRRAEPLERELEIIFTEHGNEWFASDRNAVEQTTSGEDVDQDTLLNVVDQFVVA